MPQKGKAFSKCAWLSRAYIPSLEDEYPEAYDWYQTSLEEERSLGRNSEFWTEPEPKPQPTISKQMFKRAFDDAYRQMPEQLKLSRARSIFNRAIRDRIDNDQELDVSF